MCNPLMCNIFLSNLCFASCPLCATLRKNFNSKMTKINGNGLNMVFKMIELTSKTVFYYLYRKVLPLFTINWPLFFKMGEKSLSFYQKFYLHFFWAMSPMCNNVPNVQHFFGEFRCCTLGYNRCNAFRRTKSTELNPRNLDFNRLSVEVIFTKISADLNEENNVIRLHLRRTERVLSEREARYFEVSAFLHT